MAEVSVKQERVDDGEVDRRILELCQENTKGINEDVILREMPFVKGQPLADAINRLTKKGFISLNVNPQTKQLIYKLLKLPAASESLTNTPSSAGAAVLKGAGHHENLVYQIISEAGNKGIWRKEIHRRSGNLPQQEFDKILKALESRKAVKQVCSVQASRKKVYMLFNLEPDRSVTGGSWYTEQDFDSEFVDLIIMLSHRFLEQKAEKAKLNSEPIAQRNLSLGSSAEVWQYIKESNISKHPLSVEDIESILDTLVYEGRAEMECGVADDGQPLRQYRVVTPWTPPTGLTRMPCGMCPLINECRLGGVISPETCEYLKDWLANVT